MLSAAVGDGRCFDVFCRRTWCLTLPAILCGFLFGFQSMLLSVLFAPPVGSLLHCFWLDEGFACCFCLVSAAAQPGRTDASVPGLGNRLLFQRVMYPGISLAFIAGNIGIEPICVYINIKGTLSLC